MIDAIMVLRTVVIVGVFRMFRMYNPGFASFFIVLRYILKAIEMVLKILIITAKFRSAQH